MNTNRNIPYIYNVKDIDWTALKAVGIGKEQLEADGSLDLLLHCLLYTSDAADEL